MEGAAASHLQVHSARNEAFGELRKKGHGESSCAGGLRFPSFGSELLQDKARLLETECCWTKQEVGALRAPCFPAQAAQRGTAMG